MEKSKNRAGNNYYFNCQDSYEVWSNNDYFKGENITKSLLLTKYFSGNFESLVISESADCNFLGAEDSYFLTFKLPRVYSLKGFFASFTLLNWEIINYVAIGFNINNEFKHVKLESIVEGMDASVQIDFDSLAWKLSHSSEKEHIDNIRIYLKGKPKKIGGRVNLHSIGVTCTKNSGRPKISLQNNDGFKRKLENYLIGFFPFYVEQANSFLNRGTCPIINGVNVDWSTRLSKPVSLTDNNTVRYSWFALHPVTILLLGYQSSNNLKLLYGAKDIFLSWYYNSYLGKEPDTKYNWYDHGIAERQLALILLYKNLNEIGTEIRSLQILENILFKQSELLASEVIYCRDQGIRYHNHGCFQDLALLVSSKLFTEPNLMRYWQNIALSRLEEQINNIVVREKNVVISKENSHGYQYFLFNILNYCKDIAFEERLITTVSDDIHGIAKFLQATLLPDGRLPSIGDTYKGVYPSIKTLNYEQGMFAFNKAGYIFIQQIIENISISFAFIASSQGSVHKHKDNLSFTLEFDGIEWFNDPSFYSHDYQEEKTKHLRSEYAHNCVVIDGQEYELGLERAKITNTTEQPKSYLIEAEHSCYEGAKLTRSILFSKQNLSLEIIDTITPANPAITLDAFVVFNLGIGVRSKINSNEVVLSHPDSKYTIQIVFESEEINITKGWDNNSKFKGISGGGFLEYHDTECLFVPLSNKTPFKTEIHLGVGLE